MPTISGYAAVFYDGTKGTEYTLGEIRGKPLVERILPTAFDAAIRAQSDVVGLFNHDFNNLLGRVSNETLSIATDGRGLRYDIDAPDTQLGRDVAALQERGDLRGSSFSFRPTEQNNREEESRFVREIASVELYDVGPVTIPAYDGTNEGRDVRSVSMAMAPLPVTGEQLTEARSQFQAFLTEEELAAIRSDSSVAVRLRMIELDTAGQS